MRGLSVRSAGGSRFAYALILLIPWLFASLPATARDTGLAPKVERDVASGAVFFRDRMRREAIDVLDSWATPSQLGGVARRLAVKLDGISVAAFMAAVAAEKHAERTEVKGIPGHGDKRQIMTVWEWPDSTVVRFKPLGDRWRDAPTYSIEVKDSRNLSNDEARQDSIAFKVDPKGRAVPTGPRQVRYPNDLPKDRIDDYVDAVMDLGHRKLKP